MQTRLSPWCKYENLMSWLKIVYVLKESISSKEICKNEHNWQINYFIFVEERKKERKYFTIIYKDIDFNKHKT